MSLFAPFAPGFSKLQPTTTFFLSFASFCQLQCNGRKKWAIPAAGWRVSAILERKCVEVSPEKESARKLLENYYQQLLATSCVFISTWIFCWFDSDSRARLLLLHDAAASDDCRQKGARWRCWAVVRGGCESEIIYYFQDIPPSSLLRDAMCVLNLNNGRINSNFFSLSLRCSSMKWSLMLFLTWVKINF